jgi:two-component system NarL family sensor kinase
LTWGSFLSFGGSRKSLAASSPAVRWSRTGVGREIARVFWGRNPIPSRAVRSQDGHVRKNLALALAAVAAVELLVAVWTAAALTVAEVVDSYMLTNAAMGAGFAACGAVLAHQRPRNPIGWLLLPAGIAHLTSAATVGLIPYGLARGWPAALLSVLLTVFNLAWPFGITLLLPLALQLFPNGRLVSRAWRWPFAATVVLGLAFVLTGAGSEPLVVGGHTVQPAFTMPGYDRLGAVWTLANAASIVGLAAAIAGLVIRYRRGDERLRRQLLWLVLALVVAVALNLPRWVVGDGPILLLLAMPLVPIAITIAILRHGLLDIRLVVSRALLYLVLSLAVVVAYTGLIAALDAVLRGAGAPVLATLLIALAFNPVRVRVQRAVDRLFYGARSDPVHALSRVGERLSTTDDLAGVLDGIRDALRLPFAALRRDGRELAAAGEPPEMLHAVPLTFRGGRVGELVVGVRRGERALGPADLAVLGLLAPPLAAALHATALAEEVQGSRERIVAAREEERRRLHRDLHDGLGPTLTGAGYKADAACNVLTTEPGRAAALLDDLRHDIGTAIDDVRRVVYALRPPALDQFGLVGALRRHCDGLPLTVVVDAPDHLPALPAAVEVAAYRIVTEALTNVTRHAAAHSVRITLTVDTALEVSIVDDGTRDAAWRDGVGLASMRERAAELGGTCTAGPTPAGGRVEAVLPTAVPAVPSAVPA